MLRCGGGAGRLLLLLQQRSRWLWGVNGRRGAAHACLLLGSAGSGKGTQARLLERHGFTHLDFGQGRRESVALGTPAGRKIAALGDPVSRGRFYDDALVAEVFVELLRRRCRTLGGQHHTQKEDSFYVLDGFPRTLEQLRLLQDSMPELNLSVDLAIVLHTPFEVLLRRTDGRLIHPASGRTYHPTECPPHEPMRDDMTGEPLEPRVLSSTLDAEDALRTRIEIEAREMASMMQALATDHKLVHVDQGRSVAWFDRHRHDPEQLNQELLRVLAQHGLKPSEPRTRARPAPSPSAPPPASASSPAAPLRNVAIAGIGPHAMRIYYPFLLAQAKTRGVRVPIVVDLEEQRERTERYLRDQHEPSGSLAPPEACFVPSTHPRHADTLHPDVEARLDALHAAGSLDGLVISSEASAHLPYLRWALSRGVDVMLDKPPVIPANPFDPARIAGEFDAALRLAEASPASNVAVCVHRRAHPGYRFVQQLLRETVAAFQVPVSFLDLYHADGMWCMPGEMATRESHPFKYGYGKLLFSGYHFVDLCPYLLSANNYAVEQETTMPNSDLELACVPHAVQQFGAPDLMHQLPPERLAALTTGATAEAIRESLRQYEAGRRGSSSRLGTLGELNVHAMLQQRERRSGHVVSTVAMNLLHNSFSRRGWFHPRADTYKGNGRVRHERLVANVGPLLSVHVDSYQSHESGQPDDPAQEEAEQEIQLATMHHDSVGRLSVTTRDLLERVGVTGHAEGSAAIGARKYSTGGQEHFDVTVYRNVAACGGERAFEQIPLGRLLACQHRDSPTWLGQNEFARGVLLQNWLDGVPGAGYSPLKDQRDTMHLVGQLYQALHATNSSSSKNNNNNNNNNSY